LLWTSSAIAVGGGLYFLSREEEEPISKIRSRLRATKGCGGPEGKKKWSFARSSKSDAGLSYNKSPEGATEFADDSAWSLFAGRFAKFAAITDIQWTTVPGSLSDLIIPDWAKILPECLTKLQKELSMAPGSLADEIWQEAHDPYINPEIEYSAEVRVSTDLCKEEKEFRARRRKFARHALAKYLDLPEEDIHPDDVPCIAMVGSGGGLRALVAGAGSMLATGQDGLFDCVTYTAGVSGSCWLQALYHSSLGDRRFDKIVDHLKARLGVHIAYPPVAFNALNSAPTNKFLLSGFVEKLKGDQAADFGLVDVYGLLLAARLLVPKAEITVDDRDLKISNQRNFLRRGEHPMPIYTVVRHEIPIEDKLEGAKTPEHPSEKSKEKARKEAWFQWFEISPYEMFCEEFAAGIPTWAMGRKFENGKDLPSDETGMRVPELRLTLLLGVFGSAFCATLSHYYKEIRPIIKGLTGLGGIDGVIVGRNEDLSKVHPIDPAQIPNFAYKMEGKLPATTPESVYKSPHLQLMDAGMSNNLPIYPLLRPGRDVDILIAFDASADIRTENWLSVADGYARQRGIKGWPIGAGWPKASDTAEEAAGQLDEAQAKSVAEAEHKIQDAKEHPVSEKSTGNSPAGPSGPSDKKTKAVEKLQDLGYCTIWIGTTEERSGPSDHVPSKAVEEDWQLMHPNAGIAVVYFPFMKNPKVTGVDPETSDYMSTWNFVYTPEDVDSVVALARANFDEGKERTRRCVRAVYERKKKQREEAEKAERDRRYRRKVRLGIVGKKGEGDHFHLT
jgi:phospholipase A2